MKIRKQREKIDLQIAKLNDKRCALQTECSHDGAIRTSRADTGNYSKSDDLYWYEFRCPDCDKFWSENQ